MTVQLVQMHRYIHMPNVVLLIPIADILDVTVTELLRGEKIDTPVSYTHLTLPTIILV